MKTKLFAILGLLLTTAWLSADVVRPAPNIAWLDSAGKTHGLSEFKGRPVLVLIAPSPTSRIFRSQVGQLHQMYERMAADKLVCIAAFTEEGGRIKSNVPFAIAANGQNVAAAYDISKFGIAIIGRDGNLDCVSARVLPAQRIFDLMANSFKTQEAMRRP